MMFDHDLRGLFQQISAEGNFEQILIGFEVIGRIEEDDIGLEILASQRAQGGEHVLLNNAKSSAYAAKSEIMADQAVRGSSAFDKHGLTRTTAQSLDADCSRASKGIQNHRAGHEGPKDIEQGFLKPIPRRP